MACQAHINVHKVLEDDAYVAQFRATLEKYGLNVWALGAHLIGQCVGDNWDPRLDNFAPNALAGRPDEIRAWAVEEMKTVARAAQKLGVKVVTCFLGILVFLPADAAQHGRRGVCPHQRAVDAHFRRV